MIRAVESGGIGFVKVEERSSPAEGSEADEHL